MQAVLYCEDDLDPTDATGIQLSECEGNSVPVNKLGCPTLARVI